VRSWLLGAVVVACATGAGCDALFGIDSIPPAAHDASTSGDLGTVRGQYLQLWAENDAIGMAVEMQRELPANQLTAIATLDDGTPRAVTIDDTSFSFTTPHQGDHYTLRFETPTQARTFELSAATPVLVERTTKRPSDLAAPPGTLLTFNVTARHTENNAKEELVTTGTWSRHQIASTDRLEINCASPDPNGAVVDMLSPHDAVYYTSTQTVGSYVRILYAAQARDVMTVGGTGVTVPTLPTTPASVAATGCTNITIHGAEETAREMIATGGGTSIIGWFVNADPGLQHALLTWFPLANGLGDVSTMVMYGNPFGLSRIDAMAATLVQNAAGASSSVAAIMPAGDCSQSTEILAGQVALASNVRVGTTQLAASGVLVTVPKTGDADVTFDVSSDGDANYFVVHLDQIVGSSFTTLEDFVTSAHVVHIPVSRFLTTNSYRIRVDGMLGFPNASEGDFMTAAVPAAISEFVTPAFRPQ
jgi:hypothetical protein